MKRKLTALLLALVMALSLLLPASASRELTTIWVICRPESEVNIRERPSSRSEKVGYASAGDSFLTDEVKKKGFIHVFASIETMEGWIAAGYVVEDEPSYVGETRTIEARGKVRVRDKANGKRIGWVRPGDEVFVYYISEWCVTDRGYIWFEYIGEE